MEDMRAAGEGTSGTLEFDEEDELLGDNTGAPRGYSKIVAQGRRQREEALHPRQE